MTIYSKHNPPIGFYVYAYINDTGLFYYVGKGKDLRAWKPHRRANNSNILPKDNSKILILAHRLNENEAYLLESKLIKQYGRRDLETGTLLNLSDGGPGPAARVWTDEQRKHHRDCHIGKNLGRILGPQSPELIAKRAKANIGRNVTEASNEKRRKAMLGRGAGIAKPSTICPHCGKEGSGNVMHRYHFAKCKHK